MGEDMLLLLGICDVVAGIFLFFGNMLGGSMVLIVFGSIIAFKGLYSLVASIGVGYLYDWMGFLDLLVGLLLVAAFYGYVFDVSWAIGLFVLLKGLYSVFFWFIRG